MVTLLDWNTVSHKVASYVGESPYCTNLSRAFTYVLLEYLLCLSPEEIEDAITDGPDDRGIDAVYVDEGDGRNIIHLFQFKHVGSFAQAKSVRERVRSCNHTFPFLEQDRMSSIKELVYSNAEFTWTPRDGAQLSLLNKCGLLSDQ